MKEPVVAFVAGSIGSALIDIQSHYHVVRMFDPRTGILWRDGKQWRFVIVTREQHAWGLKVWDYIWLPSSLSLPRPVRDQIRRTLDACKAMVAPADRRAALGYIDTES